MQEKPEPIVYALASWEVTRLDIFKADEKGVINHKFVEGVNHSPWESIGEPMASRPAACSWGKNRLDICAKGTDNAIWHNWYDGKWNKWESIGGNCKSAPSITTRGENSLDVFAQNQDGTIGHCSYDGGWKPWENFPGVMTSAPSATSWGGKHLSVFCKDENDSISHKLFNGMWNDWEALGGEVTSAPAAINAGPGKLDVYAAGKYDSLWHRWNAGKWLDWKYFGGEKVGTPSAVTLEDGKVVVCCAINGKEVCYRAWDGNFWSEWNSLEKYETPKKVTKTKRRQQEFKTVYVEYKDIFAVLCMESIDYFNLDDYKKLFLLSKSFKAKLFEKSEDFTERIFGLVLSHGQKCARNWYKKVVLRDANKALGPAKKNSIQKLLTDTKNGINNSTGSEGFNYWTVNAQHKWSISADYPHNLPGPRKKPQKAFTGTNVPEPLEQIVQSGDFPILKERNYNCAIEGGCSLIHRPDCPSNVKVKFQVIDINDVVISEKSLDKNFEGNYDFSKGFPYKHLIFKIDDPKIVQSAVKCKVVVSTNDLKGWAGFYGTTFTDFFIRIVPMDYYA